MKWSAVWTEVDAATRFLAGSRRQHQVIYEFDAERVVIHLVFHTSQDPGKWRERLGLT